MNRSAHLLTTAFLSTACLSSLAADWPQFRGPSMDGISKEADWSAKSIEGGGKVLWKAPVGIGFSSISVADGRAYTMGNTEAADTVWCFDAVTGKELWKHSYPEELKPNLYEGGPNATPTVSGGRLFTLSKTGKAFCFDAAKGTVIWQKDLAQETGAKKPEWGYASSALIVGDLVIYNVGTAGTALNKETGAVAWKSGADAAGYTTGVPFMQGSDRLIALITAQNLVALNPATGAQVWSHPWKTQYDINAADPIIAGNQFFISSGYNHGASVVEVTGNKSAVLWENKELRNQMASSVLWKGHVYGMDEGQLRCVDFKTGTVKWTDKATGKGTLLIADGKIIALGEKGELLIAEATPEGFQPLARAQILTGKCWTMPVLAHSRLYARNARGDLVCLDLSGQ